MNLAGYQDVLAKDADTALKVNISWHFFFPGSSTTPFPIYGLFRYLYLVHRKEGGGSPSDMMLKDRPLLACVALWGIAVVMIIYRPFGS